MQAISTQYPHEMERTEQERINRQLDREFAEKVFTRKVLFEKTIKSYYPIVNIKGLHV